MMISIHKMIHNDFENQTESLHKQLEQPGGAEERRGAKRWKLHIDQVLGLFYPAGGNHSSTKVVLRIAVSVQVSCSLNG